MPNPKHEVRSKRMFCAYVLKTRRFLTPALMVHGSRPRWYTNHVYTQHSIFPLCDVLSGCATPISTTLASLGYWYSKENLWPRRDLNTQPSDLESDALPLRHGVTLIRAVQKDWGSTEIWTRIAGFRVLSANHYTIEPNIEQVTQEVELIYIY